MIPSGGSLEFFLSLSQDFVLILKEKEEVLICVYSRGQHSPILLLKNRITTEILRLSVAIRNHRHLSPRV